MKKRVLPFVTSILSVLLLASCGKGPNFDSDTTSQSFEGSSYKFRDYLEIEKMQENLSVGETKPILINTLPTHYALDQVKFESMDESVATVDELGKITGVSKGFTFINITSDDGTVSTRMLVSVTESVDVSTVQPAVDAIGTKYENSHVSPTKYFKTEYSEDIYFKNGKEQYGMKSYETMAYDAKSGYLMIQSEDLVKRVEDGEYEKYSGEWLFYVKNQSTTRFMHITETSKNFIDIPTGGYADRNQIIVDILNMFFSSGEKFLNDDLNSFDGKDDYDTFLSDTASECMSYYSAGGNNLYYTYEEEGQGTVSVEDELNYVDIPKGTKYIANYVCDGFFNEDRQLAYSFKQGFSYQLGEDNWIRQFNRSTVFESDFEKKTFPSDSEELSELGYNNVETISDL